MHEIIHLSLSAVSNHIHSHFYNAQESYFVYDDSQVKDSFVDPSILFQQGKGYTPRAILWDMRGGFGSLSSYSGAYTQEKGDDQTGKDIALWDQEKAVEIRQAAIAKSRYQESIDLGKPLPKLNAANTKYWSDYLNINLHPKSLESLTNWESDPVDFPKGRLRGQSSTEFLMYEAGVEEFATLNDDNEYLERTFRPFLELCDSISGVSLSTEVDSGWGGFSAELLTQLRDDFIPRLPVFVWASHSSSIGDSRKVSWKHRMSMIRTTCRLVEQSSLYIPITAPIIPDNFILERGLNIEDLKTLWGQSAFINIAFESLSVISSLRHAGRMPMQHIIDTITEGNNRNIISGVAASVGQHWIDLSTPFSGGKSAHNFKKAAIKRAPSDLDNTASSKPQTGTKFGLVNIRDPRQSILAREPQDDVYESYVKQDEYSDSAAVEFICPQTFSSVPSLPAGMTNLQDRVCSYFTVSDAPRNELLKMADTISRTRLDDREELRENLSNFAQEYDNGWLSEEELDV